MTCSGVAQCQSRADFEPVESARNLKYKYKMGETSQSLFCSIVGYYNITVW